LTCINWFSATLRVALLAVAAGAAWAQSDADVLAAREAALRGQWKVVEGYRARLAGHPLEAYPLYWQLAGSVDRHEPRAILEFLDRHADSPLSEALRREWLRTLGAAGSWETFRAEYPMVLGDDVEITCYSFQERLARGDAEAASEARALFLSQRETTSACDPVFARLLDTRVLSENETWERVRRFAASGNLREARRANALLPARTGLNEKALEKAHSDAARYLAQEKSTRFARPAQELVVVAISRLSRNKPEEAADRLAAFASRLDPGAARFAWGQVAWQAAMSHHPRALEWYALASPAPLTDTQVAWRVRAALRAGDWKETLAAIQALSPEEARESGWRYWRARSLRALGSAEAGDAILREMAEQHTFYGILAAEELGLVRAPDWNGWRPATEDIERARAIPGINRALILYRLGLDNEALREWQWAIRSLDDRTLLAAAEAARLAKVPDRAINTANRTVQVHDLGQRFPVVHREALTVAASQAGLEEAMVLAIIRQESRFMPEARSRVGAMGLMQLMPSTAKWVARQMSIQPFRPQMLAYPDINMQMGAYYFKRVLDALGEPILAAAAYNAGPGRASRWRDVRPMEGAIYAETIPFNETRDYVKNVLTNAWFYRHRLTGKPSSLRELLGTVGGRGDAAVVANLP
jgi:soluble lytic murein transglycosylase